MHLVWDALPCIGSFTLDGDGMGLPVRGAPLCDGGGLPPRPTLDSPLMDEGAGDHPPHTPLLPQTQIPRKSSLPLHGRQRITPSQQDTNTQNALEAETKRRHRCHVTSYHVNPAFSVWASEPEEIGWRNTVTQGEEVSANSYRCHPCMRALKLYRSRQRCQAWFR